MYDLACNSKYKHMLNAAFINVISKVVISKILMYCNSVDICKNHSI